MKDNSASVTTQVEIQGEYVLDFISLDKNQAEFEVIGITDPVIRVIDLRAGVRRKMKEILKTNKVEQLADHFNHPARITILPPQAGQMIVRLEKTQAKKPRHMLWMAIGIGDDIPMYDYKKIEIRQMEDGNYALFALYKRPRPKVKVDLP
jgi:hypothetical protein